MSLRDLAGPAFPIPPESDLLVPLCETYKALIDFSTNFGLMAVDYATTADFSSVSAQKRKGYILGMRDSFAGQHRPTGGLMGPLSMVCGLTVPKQLD